MEPTPELREAIERRDALIEQIRVAEDQLKPLIERLWAASNRVEELSRANVPVV
jgi:hypothetical protein